MILEPLNPASYIIALPSVHSHSTPTSRNHTGLLRPPLSTLISCELLREATTRLIHATMTDAKGHAEVALLKCLAGSTFGSLHEIQISLHPRQMSSSMSRTYHNHLKRHKLPITCAIGCLIIGICCHCAAVSPGGLYASLAHFL